MMSCCRRFTQPANVRRRNCSAGAEGIGTEDLQDSPPEQRRRADLGCTLADGRSSPGKTAWAEFPDTTTTPLRWTKTPKASEKKLRRVTEIYETGH